MTIRVRASNEGGGRGDRRLNHFGNFEIGRANGVL